MEKPRLEYVSTTSRAFDGMKWALFRPFDIGKWFVLGFTAWLAALADGGGTSGNLNFNTSGGSSSGGPGSPGSTFTRLQAWIEDNTELVIGLGSLLIYYFPIYYFPDKLLLSELVSPIPLWFAPFVMPKPRYLAPWHQPDLMAALQESEGLTPEELEALRGKPAIYHCISRVVDRQFVLGDVEKEQFVRYMRMYEAFSQVRVLDYCVMSNHFHILLEVPAPPEDRGASWSDRKFLKHLETLYSAREVRGIAWQLKEFRKHSTPDAAVVGSPGTELEFAL